MVWKMQVLDTFYFYSLPCHGLKDLSMLKQVDVNMAV